VSDFRAASDKKEGKEISTSCGMKDRMPTGGLLLASTWRMTLCRPGIVSMKSAIILSKFSIMAKIPPKDVILSDLIATLAKSCLNFFVFLF